MLLSYIAEYEKSSPGVRLSDQTQEPFCVGNHGRWKSVPLFPREQMLHFTYVEPIFQIHREEIHHTRCLISGTAWSVVRNGLSAVPSVQIVETVEIVEVVQIDQIVLSFAFGELAQIIKW